MNRFEQGFACQLRRDYGGVRMGQGHESNPIEPVQPGQHFHLEGAERTLVVIQNNVRSGTHFCSPANLRAKQRGRQILVLRPGNAHRIPLEPSVRNSSLKFRGVFLMRSKEHERFPKKKWRKECRPRHLPTSSLRTLRDRGLWLRLFVA